MQPVAHKGGMDFFDVKIPTRKHKFTCIALKFLTDFNKTVTITGGISLIALPTGPLSRWMSSELKSKRPGCQERL